MGERPLIDEISYSNNSKEKALPEVDPSDFPGGVLFVGCSGFRFSVRGRFGMPEGSFFTHRTLANSVTTGSNWKATFEYAVGMNDVRDVVVCGHEDCRPIQDSLKVTEEGRTEGPETDLVRLRERFREDLREFNDNKVRADKLARLNVRFQVHHLLDRIERGDFPDYGSQLRVHGWYWSRCNSQLMDLKVSRAMEV